MEILGLVLMALLSALLQPFMTRSIQVLTSVRGTKTHMGTRTIKMLRPMASADLQGAVAKWSIPGHEYNRSRVRLPGRTFTGTAICFKYLGELRTPRCVGHDVF